MSEQRENPPTLTDNETPSTPGELLRGARLGLNLSEEDVAGELYMTAYRVRLIEGNEFKKLNADAFVRGYLKAYAVLVKLDPDVVLAAYAQFDRGSESAKLLTQRKAPSHNKKIIGVLGVVVGVLALLWLVSIWFLDNRSGQAYKAPAVAPLAPAAITEAVIADPADAVAVDADEDDLAVNTLAQQNTGGAAASAIATESVSVASDAVTSAAAISAPASAVAASSAPLGVTLFPALGETLAPPVSSVASAASSSVQAAPVAAVAGLDQLRLVFSQECWLEVTDANGDVLASDLEMAGATREVQGRAPFQVKLGNARGVSLSLNGYDVPIEPREGTNVRTLRIGR